MYCWTQDVPITEEVYREIVNELGENPPEGLIVHVARVMPDGRLQYLDIWESREACERFTEERLHPIVGRALNRHRIQVDSEPQRTPIEVLHVWGSASRLKTTVG